MPKLCAIRGGVLAIRTLLTKPEKLVRTLATSSSTNHVISSPFGDVQPAKEDLTRFVFRRHKEFLDLPAISCGSTGRSYTYSQCYEYLLRFGSALINTLNLKPDDTIALVLPNIPEFTFVIFGAMAVGLKVTLANPLYTAEELTRQFINADAKCIVTINLFYDKIKEVTKNLKDYNGTITVGLEDIDEKNVYSLRTLLATNEKTNIYDIDINSVALIPYSSGTTGLPKGVMLTHKNLVTNLLQVCRRPFTRPDEEIEKRSVLTMPPFFHIYGFNGIMNYCLANGHHIITIPRFTPEDYLNCLINFKPKSLFVVPSLLTFLANHPNITREHLSCVEDVMVGAAPVTESIIKSFLNKCGKTGDELIIQQGYGMTESSPVMLITPYGHSASKVTSVGQVATGTECRVISLTTKENLGPNEKGELLCRGPQIMKGYHKNESATKDTIDEEGWLHTGDVAYYDEDRYFYIVDRTKELIKVKGNQVSPTELENVVLEIQGVADAAVVGIPDPMAGELPLAYVVLKPGATLTEKQIADEVAAKVVKYKRLEGGVKFIESIPRNPGGKILRNQLKALAVDGAKA